MSDVVVVGRRAIEPAFFSGEYLSIPVISFSQGSIPTPVATLRDLLEARERQSDPLVIEAGTRTPRTTIVGVNRNEAASVVAALANSSNSHELGRAFQEMVANNVDLRVEALNSAPSTFAAGQLGAISIPAVESSVTGAQGFRSGSQVTIIIVTGRLTDLRGSSVNFRSVLAHELAHLFRGQDGKFFNEAQTYGADSQLSRELFRNFRERDFLDRPDIVSSVQPIHGLIIGPQFEMRGTDTNNYMVGPGFYARGAVYCGAGNDIVILAEGSHNIFVGNSGAKLLYAQGFNTITFPQGVNLTDARFQRVGVDLFISMEQATSPLLAENVVVLLNWYATDYTASSFMGLQVEGSDQFRALYGI